MSLDDNISRRDALGKIVLLGGTLFLPGIFRSYRDPGAPTPVPTATPTSTPVIVPPPAGKTKPIIYAIRENLNSKYIEWDVKEGSAPNVGLDNVVFKWYESLDPTQVGNSGAGHAIVTLPNPQENRQYTIAFDDVNGKAFVDGKTIPYENGASGVLRPGKRGVAMIDKMAGPTGYQLPSNFMVIDFASLGPTPTPQATATASAPQAPTNIRVDESSPGIAALSNGQGAVYFTPGDIVTCSQARYTAKFYGNQEQLNDVTAGTDLASIVLSRNATGTSQQISYNAEPIMGSTGHFNVLAYLEGCTPAFNLLGRQPYGPVQVPNQ